MASAFEPRRELSLSHLHHAMQNNDVCMIERLLQNGEKIDARAAGNVTPLMLACLFGHREAFDLLLRHQAAVTLRDQEGKQAKDYANPVAAFTNTRWRQFTTHLADIEPLKARAKRRRVIHKLLARGDVLQAHIGRLKNESQHGECIRKQAGNRTISVLGVVKTIYNPASGSSNETTFGYIRRRGSNKILKSSVSGWTNSVIIRDLVNNQVFTRLVQVFCHQARFKLGKSPKDNPGGRIKCPRLRMKKNGRWCACHVEKKLGIWYLCSEMCKALGDDFKDPAKHTFQKDQIAAFKRLALPAARRDAWIYIDHSPCTNCLNFLQVLGHFSGIKFSVVTVPVVTETERHRTAFAFKGSGTTRASQDYDSEGADDSRDDVGGASDGQDDAQGVPMLTPTRRGAKRPPLLPQVPGESDIPSSWNPRTRKPRVPGPIDYFNDTGSRQFGRHREAEGQDLAPNTS